MTACNCILEEEAIYQDHLLCDQSSSNKTVFRAKIATNQLARDQLLMIIQRLVTGGRLTLNDSTIVRLDNSCPVEISSFNDPLCTSSVIIDNIEDGESQSNESLSIAHIAGIVVAIIVLVALLVFVLLLILYWKTKHR